MTKLGLDNRKNYTSTSLIEFALFFEHGAYAFVRKALKRILGLGPFEFDLQLKGDYECLFIHPW